MNKNTFLILIVFIIFLPANVSGEQLHLGTAAKDITPPIGWRMAGNYYEVFNTGIHDSLFAKAMVWKQGNTRAALVVIDTCSVGREISDPARRLASEKTGIPLENIIVSATHTHAGPEFYGILRDMFHDQAIQKQGTDPHEPINYKAQLIKKIAAVVISADQNTSPVSVSSGGGLQEGIVFNRRYLMKDGTVRFNPARMDPDIVRAAGPVDQELSIFLFTGDDSRPIASLTSFPMHVATFGGTEYGADFPGMMQVQLREQFGDEFFSLFGMGTSGDTNHFQFLTGKPDTPTQEIADALMDTYLATVPGLQEADSTLDMKSALVALPLREITDEQIDWAEKVLKREWVEEPGFLVLVEAWKLLNCQKLRERDGRDLQAEVQAIRLSGDAAVVSLPHEIFVELGMEIKRRSPFRDTMVITLANDMDFYIPTRKAFAEGSYEVVTSPLKPGCGEKLVDAAVLLLDDLSVKKQMARVQK